MKGEGLLDINDPAKGFSDCKVNDVQLELARLYRAVGALDSAQVIYSKIDYTTTRFQSGSDLAQTVAKYNRYSDAVVQLEDILLGQTVFDPSAFGDISRQFSFRDSSFRRGALYLPYQKSTEAKEHFEIAADLVDPEQGRPLMPDAAYFQGYAFLDSAMTEEMGHYGVMVALKNARTSFERFQELVRNAGLSRDERLGQMVSRAKRMYDLLGIAGGTSMPDERLAQLSREEVRFLIRIGASVVGDPRRYCVNDLLRFFDLNDHAGGSAGTPSTDENSAELCAKKGAESMGRNEALFLKGLVVSMQAGLLGSPQREETFAEAAEILKAVGGSYEGEAKYVRARALHKADMHEPAGKLLLELITDYHSVRALYYYGEHLRMYLGADPETLRRRYAIASTVMKVIKDAGRPPEYSVFLQNAGKRADDLVAHFCDPKSVLDIPGINRLQCPETLSVDITGLWPEVVFYETLREKNLIRRKFAADGREELAVYGLPKLWLNPTSRSCSETSILAISEPFIPDSVHMDKVWRGIVQFFNHSGDALDRVSCTATYVKKKTTIPCKDSVDGYYVLDADIITHDSASVEVSTTGYYQTYFRFTSEEPGNWPHKETLARDVHYDKLKQTSSGPYELIQNSDDAYSRNPVARRDSHKPPTKLVEHFAKDRYMRDYAYDQTNKRFLAVSSQLNNGLVVYSEKKSVDTMSLDPSTSLSNAEGIAVDNDGNIYIADWGNHRVLVLDASGHESFFFGTLGQNQTENSGDLARLTFPNRIVVEEESSGTEHPRQRHLLVSDWFGVHKFDARGRYLDSPVDTAQAGLEAGSCYEITLDGYGPGSTLRLHDLVTDQPHVYTAKK